MVRRHTVVVRVLSFTGDNDIDGGLQLGFPGTTGLQLGGLIEGFWSHLGHKLWSVHSVFTGLSCLIYYYTHCDCFPVLYSHRLLVTRFSSIYLVSAGCSGNVWLLFMCFTSHSNPCVTPHTHSAIPDFPQPKATIQSDLSFAGNIVWLVSLSHIHYLLVST